MVLTLERNETLFPNVAKTPNQRAVASALSQFPTDNPLFLAVLNQTADGARQAFDAPSIDTTSRTGKLVMGILALIAEFENDIRRERQMDGIAKARDRGVKFGRRRCQSKILNTWSGQRTAQIDREKFRKINGREIRF